MYSGLPSFAGVEYSSICAGRLVPVFFSSYVVRGASCERVLPAHARRYHPWRMPKLQVPAFVHDVIADPTQRGILIAGALSLFAVGLVPRVLSPGLPTSQEALRARPELENLFILLSFVSAAAVILGGLASDLVRRRGLMIAGLTAMVAGSVVGLLVDDGPVYYAASAVVVGALGVVLAYGIRVRGDRL